VMVTNGGYGAVQRALSDGVPLVVAGQTEDKPEVAARVEHFGVGVNLRTGTPTAAMVRHAVREVLQEPQFKAAARRLQSAYAVRNGVSEIAALVDEVIAEQSAGLRHA
jgi:UDP:flavonoid glycosyltransferase YjiC (YdhE family)